MALVHAFPGLSIRQVNCASRSELGRDEDEIRYGQWLAHRLFPKQIEKRRVMDHLCGREEVGSLLLGVVELGSMCETRLRQQCRWRDLGAVTYKFSIARDWIHAQQHHRVGISGTTRVRRTSQAISSSMVKKDSRL